MPTPIRLSVFSSVDSYTSPHDYGDAFVQGGTGGFVFRRDGESYRTAFVECSVPGTFIRGEGATLAEADDAAFAKLQAYLSCGAHEWEPRGYTNGGGFCTRCGQFGSRVFTAEQLGLFCTVCSVPTFHTAAGLRDGETLCMDHDERWPYVCAANAAMFATDEDSSEVLEAMYRRLADVARYGAPLDPDALAWARSNLTWDES